MNFNIETEKRGFFPFRFKSKQEEGLKEAEELKEELHKIKKELDLAYNNFEYATEKELIDSCIYKMMALHIKYKYFLDKVKELDASFAKEWEQTS